MKLRFILPAIAVLLVIAGLFIWRNATPSRVEKAYDSCRGLHSSPGVIELADEGHSILVDTGASVPGFEDRDFSVLGCLTRNLSTPQSTLANIDSTTALMGRQSEEHDGITYEWSYHPDNGFIMTITDN